MSAAQPADEGPPARESPPPPRDMSQLRARRSEARRRTRLARVDIGLGLLGAIVLLLLTPGIAIAAVLALALLAVCGLSLFFERRRSRRYSRR